MISTTLNKRGRTPGMKVSGIFLFFGIALAVLGAIGIAFAILFTIGSVVFFGALMVAAGIAELIHAFKVRRPEYTVVNVVSGLLYAITGALMLTNPMAGALSLTLVVSTFLVAAGVVRCAYAFMHRRQPYWGWFLLGGIIDVALGAIILTYWPSTGLWVIGLFVGIEMLVHGVAWMGLSAIFRDVENTFG